MNIVFILDLQNQKYLQKSLSSTYQETWRLAAVFSFVQSSFKSISKPKDRVFITR